MKDPSASPGRQWAARIALLLACLGSIATSSSNGFKGPGGWWEAPDISWTLSQQSPTAVRHFRIELSEDTPTSRRFELEVHVELMARWTPDSPNRQANPAIRARLIAPSEFKSDSQWSPSYSFQDGFEGATMVSGVGVAASALSLQCDTRSTCAWSFSLEVELQARDPGTVDVEGSTSIHDIVLGANQLPPGYTLSVIEE